VAAAVFGAVFFIGQEMRLSKQRGGGGVMPVASVAPDFRLYDMRNKKPSALNEYRGKPVILSFWGTWCGTCRKELPDLEKLHRESDGRFHVVTIAHDPPRRLANYLQQHSDYTMPFLVDPPGRVHRAYRVKAVPMTVIVDPDGKVVHDFTGAPDMDVLRDHMSDLL